MPANHIAYQSSFPRPRLSHFSFIGTDNCVKMSSAHLLVFLSMKAFLVVNCGRKDSPPIIFPGNENNFRDGVIVSIRTFKSKISRYGCLVHGPWLEYSTGFGSVSEIGSIISGIEFKNVKNHPNLDPYRYSHPHPHPPLHLLRPVGLMMNLQDVAPSTQT